MDRQEIKHWYNTFHRFQQNREVFWLPKIYQSLQSQIKQIIPTLKEQGIQAAMQRVHFIDPGNTGTVIKNMYIDAGRVFGAKTYQMVKKQAEKRLLPFGMNEEFVNDIIEYFRLHLLNKAVMPITETTRNYVMKVLTNAEQEGISIDDVVRQLQESEFTKIRAALIARSEVGRSANVGSMLGAKKTGFVTQKVWIAASDDRTRRQPRDEADHLHMNGVTIPYDEAFKVPSRKEIGGFDSMMQPGDASAGPEQTCNCRCTVGFKVMKGRNGLPLRL